MDVDPRLVRELTEAMEDLTLQDNLPGSANADPIKALAARMYQVGWRDKHITKAAFPNLSDVGLTRISGYLRAFDSGQLKHETVLTAWRTFVRRVDRIGDFRCPESVSSVRS